MPTLKTPSDLYYGLTKRHRDEITDHVRCCISTFRGPTLDGDDLNDIIRWTLEGLSRTSLREDAYDEGFEDGRRQGYEEGCADAPTPKAEANGNG